MREELEKLVFAGKIKQQHVDKLVALAEGGYCMHKSWGFGRITTVDTVFSRFTIDFLDKAGHTMDLAFSADSLTPIPATHIYARKLANLEALKQTAALHHLDLIKIVLESFGGQATLDAIQKILVPDVIASDWKKWWEVARREMKKDGHFTVPTKKTEPIIFTQELVTLPDRLMGDFRAAKGLAAHTAVAAEIIRNLEDLGEFSAQSAEVFATLNAEIKSHQRTQPAAALEAIFVRDDLRAATKSAPEEGELREAEVWVQCPSLEKVLGDIQAARHRRVLQSFKEAHPDDWTEKVIQLANSATPKLVGECVAVLVANGRHSEFKHSLARLISQHQASTDLLLWLAKERSNEYGDILGPEVFRAMLTAIERDLFNEKKSVRLADFILDDQELLPELIGSADLEVVQDLTRSLQMSGSFDDMDKRSLLARIVKTFPAIQSLISGDSTRQESTLVVSWESLERRTAEFDELVNKQIPANSRDIELARSYGDLRENHEFKSAKEMQKVLMRRKAELDRDLGRARGTDFANPQTDVVSIGTLITVTNLDTSEHLTLQILGAWDGDPDRGILSYLSPMAQAFINHPVGDETELESHGARHRFRIDSIAPVPVKTPAGGGTASVKKLAAAVPELQGATDVEPSLPSTEALLDGAADSLDSVATESVEEATA